VLERTNWIPLPICHWTWARMDLVGRCHASNRVIRKRCDLADSV